MWFVAAGVLLINLRVSCQGCQAAKEEAKAVVVGKRLLQTTTN